MATTQDRREAILRDLDGVDWRRKAAVEYAAGRRRPPGRFDAVTRRAVEFYRLGSERVDAAARADSADPDMSRAEAAWSQAATRADFQTLTLGGVSPEQIASLLSLPKAVVRLVESLHFDVRPKLGAPAWIFARVIAPEGAAGRHDVAARLRAAYSYGPIAAERIVTAGLRLPTEEADRFAEAALLQLAKFLEAAALPLTADQSFEVLRLRLEHDLAEQRLQLEHAKLQFRMQRWAQRMEWERVRRAATELGPLPSASNHAATSALPKPDEVPCPMPFVDSGGVP